jgi:ATP-dependent DNA ligase
MRTQARAPASAYASGCVPSLLKVKRAADAEARVIAHTPGNGRLAGSVGSLQCELKNGITCAPRLRVCVLCSCSMALCADCCRCLSVRVCT